MTSWLQIWISPVFIKSFSHLNSGQRRQNQVDVVPRRPFTHTARSRRSFVIVLTWRRYSVFVQSRGGVVPVFCLQHMAGERWGRRLIRINDCPCVNVNNTFIWTSQRYQRKEGKAIKTSEQGRGKNSLWILWPVTCSVHTWAQSDITLTFYKGADSVLVRTNRFGHLHHTHSSSGKCPNNFRGAVCVWKGFQSPTIVRLNIIGFIKTVGHAR